MSALGQKRSFDPVQLDVCLTLKAVMKKGAGLASGATFAPFSISATPSQRLGVAKSVTWAAYSYIPGCDTGPFLLGDLTGREGF